MKRGSDLGLDCAVTIPLITVYGILLACIAFSPFHGQVAVPIYIIVANIATFFIYYKDPTMGMGPWHASEAAFYVFLGTGGSPGYFVSRCACGHQAGDKLSEFVTAAFLMSLSSIALFAGVIITVGVLQITEDKHAALVAMGVYFVLINLACTVIVCLDAFRQQEGDMPLFAIINFIAVGGLIGGPVGLCLMGMRRYREKRELVCFSIFWVICFIVWIVLGFYGLSLYNNHKGSDEMPIITSSLLSSTATTGTAITSKTTSISTAFSTHSSTYKSTSAAISSATAPSTTAITTAALSTDATGTSVTATTANVASSTVTTATTIVTGHSAATAATRSTVTAVAPTSRHTTSSSTTTPAA